MIVFTIAHPRVELGYLPTFFDYNDPRPAKEQIDSAYQHGGGWRPQPGWAFDPETMLMQYPGDPAFKPLAVAKLRDEMLVVYEHEYLAIIQKDHSFEMALVN
jgi:hypothetical protein